MGRPQDDRTGLKHSQFEVRRILSTKHPGLDLDAIVDARSVHTPIPETRCWLHRFRVGPYRCPLDCWGGRWHVNHGGWYNPATIPNNLTWLGILERLRPTGNTLVSG